MLLIQRLCAARSPCDDYPPIDEQIMEFYEEHHVILMNALIKKLAKVITQEFKEQFRVRKVPPMCRIGLCSADISLVASH